jgi:tetratricopeptide (TPR) repeat protein
MSPFHRAARFAGALWLLLLLTPARAGEPASAPVPRERLDAVCQSLAAAGAPDTEAAALLAAGLPEELHYAQQPPSGQHALLAGLGKALSGRGQHACARAMHVEAARVEPGHIEDAIHIAYIDVRWLDRAGAAAERIGELARTRIADLGPHEEFIRGLVRELPAGSAPRRELLQALFDANWQPGPPGASAYWLELAQRHLADGDTAAARTAVERITVPTLIVQVRADRRFDPIVDRDSRRLDPVRAAQAQLVELRRQVEAAPRKLQPRIELNRALLELGRDAEVVAEVDAVEARVEAAGAGADLFDDRQWYAWLFVNRAFARLRQGDVDAALADFGRATRDRHGRSDTDIWFNLAALYLRLERGADARAALAHAGTGDELNPGGRLARAYLEYRTARQLDDRRAEAAALVYVLGHADERPYFALATLLEAGRPDDAAARLIAELASPVARGDLLEQVQVYERSPPLPGDVARIARWEALLAREDVRVAIDQAGRREHYALHRLGHVD